MGEIRLRSRIFRPSIIGSKDRGRKSHDWKVTEEWVSLFKINLWMRDSSTWIVIGSVSPRSLILKVILPVQSSRLFEYDFGWKLSNNCHAKFFSGAHILRNSSSQKKSAESSRMCSRIQGHSAREIDAMAGQFAFEIKLGFLIINIRKWHGHFG